MQEQTSRPPGKAPAPGWLVPVSLFVAVLVLFLAFPYPGSRNWDGWIDKCVFSLQ